MRKTLGTVAAMALVAAGLSLPATSATAASALQFSKIQYDSPGSDTGSNTSLNGEYVTIKNVSTTTKTLTGYTVKDRTGYTYTFGTFRLSAGRSVIVKTGTGTNTSTTRYWGRNWYVWNNTSSSGTTDTATLRTATGTVLDTCSWTDRSRTDSVQSKAC